MNFQTFRHGLACAIGVVTTITFPNPVHAQQPMPAEPQVVAANRAVLSQLPFSDRQDFEDANPSAGKSLA